MKAVTKAYHVSAQGRKPYEHRNMTYSSRGTDVLGEEDSLSFNHKEVDQLVHISYHCIERFARNHKVLLGTELRGDAISEDGLAEHFEGDGSTQGEPSKLEEISDDIKVSGSEDEGDQARVNDGRGTRIVPRQEIEEIGVIMRQGLVRGSSSGCRLSGSIQVREVIGGLVNLVLGGLRNWAIRYAIDERVIVRFGAIGVAVAVAVSRRVEGKCVGHCCKFALPEQIIFGFGGWRMEEEVP
jgi:hypothetical protein